MTSHRFELNLLECAGLSGEQDVIAMFEALRAFGLSLAVGFWDFDTTPTPTDDTAAAIAAGHWDWRQYWPDRKTRSPNVLETTESWSRGILRIDQPHTSSSMVVAVRGLDQWDVLLGVSSTNFERSGLTLEAWSEDWGTLLEQVGDLLYARLRPSIGLLYSIGSGYSDFTKHVLARRLGVGWRSWYGPAYVEALGRELLRGLPDRTQDLPDGGIGQAIDRSAADLVKGTPDLYDTLWPYLDQAEIAPFSPRRRRRAKQSRHAKDPIRDAVHLASEVKPHPGWSAEDTMRVAAEQAVLVARQQFNTDLDYSEESVERVEQILDRVHRASNQGVTEEDLWSLALMFGGYIGEVLRRTWGGEWGDREESTGGVFPLEIGGLTIFPVHKVHKRLLNGEEDQVWVFYQTVRAQLQHLRAI